MERIRVLIDIPVYDPELERVRTLPGVDVIVVPDPVEASASWIRTC